MKAQFPEHLNTSLHSLICDQVIRNANYRLLSIFAGQSFDGILSEDVKKIRIEDYDYPLPDDLVARYPLPERDTSRILTARETQPFGDQPFYTLPELLPENSHLVFNETKVIQARLQFSKNDHTTIEVFCLEPEEGMDIQTAMSARNAIVYRCMVGGARKWKSGTLHIDLSDVHTLEAEKLENQDGTFRIAFRWNDSSTFAEVLERAGQTPLPPYLNRKAQTSDKERYQTIFARNEGSVAAPTASLHFTGRVMNRLSSFAISHSTLTLHVGAGTFKPVDTDHIGDHTMHAEELFIGIHFIENLLQQEGKRIIPVGTTAMRALESLHWMGCLVINGKRWDHHEIPLIGQWVPYQAGIKDITAHQSLTALHNYMRESQRERLQLRTAILIAPGYTHKICGGLLTNFHQPKSTLLLLVASLMGNRWKDMYRYALDHRFRFLSYGDACLILQ